MKGLHTVKKLHAFLPDAAIPLFRPFNRVQHFRVNVHKIIKIQILQLIVDQLPETAVLPLFNAHALQKLIDGEVRQVYLHLQVIFPVPDGGIGNPYVFRAIKIHGVCAILPVTEIHDQLLRLFQVGGICLRCFCCLCRLRCLCCFSRLFCCFQDRFHGYCCLRFPVRLTLDTLTHIGNRFLPEDREPPLYLQILQAHLPVPEVHAVYRHAPPVNDKLHPQRDIVDRAPLLDRHIRGISAFPRLRAYDKDAVPMPQRLFHGALP